MDAINAFNDSLRANGNWIYAAGIGSPDSAKLIDNRGGASVSSSASLQAASGDLYYSGFWLVEADNEAQANEIAAAGSRACNRRVELRPFLGN
jgi:hypothetical protein